MHGPVSCLQGLAKARAGGIFDYFPSQYVRYLTAVASVSRFCYPVGSRKWLSRRIKLVALSALHGRIARPWLRAAASCALLQRVVTARPVLLERPYRPLGANGLCFAERARLVLDHYAAVRDTLPVCVCDSVYLSGGMTRSFAEGAYTLRLADAGQNTREGELAFYWTDTATGACLSQLSFYLRRGADGPEIYIGGLQGPMHDASLDWIRASTRACEGLRPKDAVMQALFGFARRIGARRIVAVSRANHVGRHRLHARQIQCDYEGFWAEYHGAALPDGNIEMPAQPPERDIAEIASKKRSAWRRKQALAALIRDTVADALHPASHAAGNDDGLPAIVPAA